MGRGGGEGRREDMARPDGVSDALFEKEDLTPVQQLNEYIMISLRTMEGCELLRVSERFRGCGGAAVDEKTGAALCTGRNNDTHGQAGC